MVNAKTIPAPPDIGAAGVFLEMLETFLTNRMRGTRKEDLLRGAPWEDEEVNLHYFPIASLEKFLIREGVKIDRNMIKHRIEKLKGGHRTMQIKGNHRSIWFVPSDVVNQAPELDTPEKPKELL